LQLQYKRGGITQERLAGLVEGGTIMAEELAEIIGAQAPENNKEGE
jgi:hypothetical protein